MEWASEQQHRLGGLPDRECGQGGVHYLKKALWNVMVPTLGLYLVKIHFGMFLNHGWIEHCCKGRMLQYIWRGRCCYVGYSEGLCKVSGKVGSPRKVLLPNYHDDASGVGRFGVFSRVFHLFRMSKRWDSFARHLLVLISIQF